MFTFIFDKLASNIKMFCVAIPRYDLSCVNRRFLVRALTLQNGTVACLFYFVGLVVSLSIAATDDKISLFKLFADLWSNKEVYMQICIF